LVIRNAGSRFYGDTPMITSMILARLASWRRYRQTFRELEALNDRELADLGLGRRDIRTVARQASH
jgi:uncharacterized protein YjiS (DUF1127 family)